MEGDFPMTKENVKTRNAYRQGELLFLRLCEQDIGILDPESRNVQHPRWRKLDTDVLREGEATGHKHQVLARTALQVTILAPAQGSVRGLPDMSPIGNEDRLLMAEGPVDIAHPEHRALTLPKGRYLVVVQREYDEVKARRILD
jgi:hypothetical protein